MIETVVHNANKMIIQRITVHGGGEFVLLRACSNSQCSMYGCLNLPGLMRTGDTGVVAYIHLASARLLRSFHVERTRIV